VRRGGRQAYALVMTMPEGARVEGVLDVALLSRASQPRANAGWALLAALLSLRVGRGGRYVH